MFRFLVRFLGSGAGRGRPARANVRRFTPRLEALETRATPSGGINLGSYMVPAGHGGEVFAGHAAVRVTPFGGHGESGGASGRIGLSITRSSGEEIPQQNSITRSSGEEIPQHTTGPIGLSITRSSGEEIPQT